MQLNVECIRDILLTIEQECDGFREFRISLETDLSAFEHLSKYNCQEVIYHVRQCNEQKLFTKCTHNILGEYAIYDLSPSGHEFLGNIRSNSVWNKLKEALKQGWSFTLKSAIQLASAFALEFLKNQT